MTRLRTQEGVLMEEIKSLFGEKMRTYLLQQAEKHIIEQLLFLDEDRLVVTKQGKFLSDGIAADLFLLNLV